MFIICTFQLFTMYWNRSLFGLEVWKILFVFLASFFVFASFTFLAYVGSFNLWWAKIPSCKPSYSISTTRKSPGKIYFSTVTGSKYGQVRFEDLWAQVLTWTERKRYFCCNTFFCNWYWSEYEIQKMHKFSLWNLKLNVCPYQKVWLSFLPFSITC